LKSKSPKLYPGRIARGEQTPAGHKAAVKAR
jgi:hypothetical protein